MFKTMFKLSAYLIVLFFVTTIQALEYQSHRLEKNTLVITTDQGLVSINARSKQAFEVFYQPNDLKQLPSFALSDVKGKRVNAKNNTHDDTQLKLTSTPSALEFTTGKLTAIIEKSPLRIRYFQGVKLLLEEEVGLFLQDTVTAESRRGFRFKLQPKEKLIGGGQRVLGMDRRGHRLPLYNKASYGYSTQANQMYFGLSAVMSSRQYVLIFDNSASGMMDLGATESDVMQFEAVAGRTAYIIVAGHSYPELINNFVNVTGKQPLPPRWALGNFASRFGYKTEQQARDVVQKFIDEDYPLDAIVLDLYWFGKDIKGFMGNLDWDKGSFPNPVKMIADFKQKGVKTILITEPFILSSSSKWQEAVDNKVLAQDHTGAAKQYDFYFGNTGLIDVFDNHASSWFTDIYSDLFKQGVAGWWGDLGEPEVHPADSIHNFNGIKVTGDEIHNAYGHMWAKRVYENQLSIAPQQRPFIMMRSGFVGSQRYGMIPWTGDVSRSWDGLKPQVELSLQMGLLGLAYTHSDLGGFAGGDKFDSQMYTRWLQYGVFQPVFRPHAQDNIAPEPIFHGQKTKDILRKYVKLRYAMLPYNYSLAYENSLTGLPLMRPMFFEQPSNLALMDIKDTYMWGDAFLVKPITEPNLTEISIDLPKGIWFDYWTDTAYEGNQSITLATALERLPVMVRGGAFVPMVEPVQSTDEYSTQQLILHYYAHQSVSSATAKMYDDDGVNPNAIASGQYQTLLFNAQHKKNRLQLTLAKQGDFKGAPTSRQMSVVIHNWADKPNQVKVAGKSVVLYSSHKQLMSKASGGFWDKTSKQLTIKLTWQDELTIVCQ